MTAPVEIGSRSGRSMADWMRQRLGSDVASRVVFLGEQPRAAIATEMRRCAFVVIPSLRESYSYVCCEALGAGRPVVVSAGIGATEVAGDACITFKRGDASELQKAMDTLWENIDLRAGLSRVAFDRARSVLSGEAVIARRVSFYESVIARRRAEDVTSIDSRLGSLPVVHAARVRLARAFADGAEERRLVELMQQAGLRKTEITPGQRVVAALDSVPNAFLFYLYGAGRHTSALLLERARWEAKGYRLAGLIDDHPRFQAEPRFMGFAVMSIHEAEQQLNRGDIVILSTDAFEDQFWRQSEPLRARGVLVHRLYGA